VSQTSGPPGARQEDAPGAQYLVRLENFEGPLDLLLHLIQQHELDILDIPIAFVAERYVSYITLMQELNIDVASEYLLMAATLTHIKSKMLLPVVPEDQDEPDAESELDPRADLVRRLLEYQKYKDAAEQLGSRSIVGRDVFSRGSAAPTAEGPAPLAQIGLFKLLDAFQHVLDRLEKTLDHQVEFERLSITERINELVDLLRERPRCEFTELFTGQKTRLEVITTFLALLEMTRLRMTRLTQESPLAPIYVEACLGDAAMEESMRDQPIDFGGGPESPSLPRDREVGEVGEEPDASPSDAELAAAALDDLVEDERGDAPLGDVTADPDGVGQSEELAELASPPGDEEEAFVGARSGGGTPSEEWAEQAEVDPALDQEPE
jgi:segregation and condensation protein A